MAPPAPPEVAKRGRPRRPKGMLSLLTHAAAMAAAIAIFLLVAAASTALLLVLVAAARASRRHRGSRYCVPALEPPAPPPAVLSPADLHRLPSFAFPSSSSSPCDDDDKSSTTCAVCLEAARVGERWRAMLACRHAFHAACVDRWLARSPACPLCRTAVTAPTS